MARRAVYLTHASAPDPAIWRGLQDAGCEVIRTRDFEQTLTALSGSRNGCPPLLVADVQAGAIALLALLRARGEPIPASMLLDHEGVDIHAPIKALEFNVRAYLLTSQPDFERHMMSRLVAEGQEIWNRSRGGLSPAQPSPSAQPEPAEEAPEHAHTRKPIEPPGLEWDTDSHMIRAEGKHIHLSPVEGRIFDLLLLRFGRTVTSTELASFALGLAGMDAARAGRRLRPHMMRLRHKLASQPGIDIQVITARGVGYLLA
jgi:DNA-binding response OmpR family regulator